MKTFKSLLTKPSNAFNFNIGIIILFALVALYMYFLSMSVVHVVLRKEVMQKTAALESQIATLEASYITAQHTVSNKMSALENFTQNDTKVFIQRNESTLVFSDTSR